MNKEEITQFMSKSKDIREWNSRRATLISESTTKEQSKLISTLVDGSGLVVKVLGNKSENSNT